jgi:hypothetical protein
VAVDIGDFECGGSVWAAGVGVGCDQARQGVA